MTVPFFLFTGKIGTCEKFQPCFKGFLCTANPLAKRLHLMSECENYVDLHSSYKLCDLSNYEKLLHACSLHWSSYRVGSICGHCLLQNKARSCTCFVFVLWKPTLDGSTTISPLTHSSLEERKKEEGREKEGRLAEASRNGRPRREESGGSVKGISAGSRSGKVEKLEPICHKEFPLNKLGGFLLKDPSAWTMWKIKQK